MEWPCSSSVKKISAGIRFANLKKKNSSFTFNEKCFYWNVYIIAIMYECCLLNKSSYKTLLSITFKYSCNVKKYPRGSDLPISM